MPRAAPFAIACCLALAGGCRPHHVHDGPVDGRGLYEHSCMQCHGADGRGQTDAGRAVRARDLTRAEMGRISDAEIAHQIVAGKGPMPAFASLLDDEEVAALVRYVRQLGTAPSRRAP